MAGETCLVTGATAGIGRVTALELAHMGANVVIVGRNPAKCAVTAIDIREETGNPEVEFLVADLSSQDQIRCVVKAFKERHQRLDVLVNNAGAIFLGRKKSVDGIEKTFALNHLSYFLLTNLLLDVMKDSAPARIINVSSSAHKEARINMCDIHAPHRYFGWRAYSRSKLCNVLFTYELARRIKGTGITVNALHPGLVATNFLTNNGLLSLFCNFFLGVRGISVEAGASTSVYAATSPDMVGLTGKYMVKKRSVRSSKSSYDEEQAAALWELSALLTGVSLETLVREFVAA
ncbi:MAG TPA: SDR family oxidoreductase [Dehalococcoidia bacterium]|nr:SDR family oxidoreductase [Dehalococcoidia bacterium]